MQLRFPVCNRCKAQAVRRQRIREVVEPVVCGAAVDAAYGIIAGFVNDEVLGLHGGAVRAAGNHEGAVGGGFLSDNNRSTHG